MSGSQRRWSRVERPGSYRGHALVGTFRGREFHAWENADGSWSVQSGDPMHAAPDSEVKLESWTKVREYTEGPARNPLDVLLAKSASIGASMGMRHASNPSDLDAILRLVEERARVVAQVLPPSQWLVGGSLLSRDGVMRIPVRLGYGPAARQRMQSAGVPFPYEIVEVS